MPQGASVPALGLSNKAVYDEEKKIAEPVGDKKSSLADDLYKEVYFNVIDLKSESFIWLDWSYVLTNYLYFFFVSYFVILYKTVTEINVLLL